MRFYLTPLDRKLTTQLVLVLVVAAFAHNLFHEFGHWLVGTLLGNPMHMNLNFTWPVSGHFHEKWHATASSIGGPGFSILMAATAWIVVREYATPYAYPFLFFPLYCRTFSLLFGGFAEQDEAHISALLGLGKYTAALIVCAILLGLVWGGSRRLKLDAQAIGNWCVVGTAAQLLVIATSKLIL